MEVCYQQPVPRLDSLSEATAWLRAHRQPLVDGSEVQLGQGATPLVSLPRLGSGLYLKNETTNPTWSHKDRANSINAAAAQLFGATGLTATSTGNHGASVAAFAAAAGLRSIIVCRPQMPAACIQMIWSYGGLPYMPEEESETEAIARFLASGWYPATSMERGPGGQNVPYAAEAYKRIAWELIEQLGGFPASIFVPTASGDTYYGVAKGFHEAALCLNVPPPRVVAVQPAGANPLQRSLELGTAAVVDGASSIALSIANERTGIQALEALRRWNGEVVTVTEEEIVTAWDEMATSGHLLEPASAASLAGYRAARRLALVRDGDKAVLLGTASGAKWLNQLDGRLADTAIISMEALADALSASGTSLTASRTGE